MRLLLIFRTLQFTVLTQAGGILDSLPELALAAQLNDTSEPEGSLKLSTDGLLLLLTSRVCVVIAFYDVLAALSLEFSITFIVVGAVLLLIALEGFCGVCGTEVNALWIVCTLPKFRVL